MSTLTVDSSRFGAIEIDAAAIIDFPTGLIGLGGRRYTLVDNAPDGAFAWLQSLEDPELALPVTNPWRFFADYTVDLSDEDTARVGAEDPADVSVLVTVRAGAELTDFSANLCAPIIVWQGRGHQVINQADGTPVRAPLFPQAEPQPAAA
jgi:flagellar assembly factor FliW